MKKTSKRATDDQLDEMHQLTAVLMLQTLRAYTNGEVKNPETGLPVVAPPAFLTSVANFLKSNGVDRAVRVGDPEDILKDELPEFTDNVVPMRAR